MLKTKEGMPSGAPPRIVAWILPWGDLGIPNLWVLSLLILLISTSHPKLETSITQNLTELGEIG